MNADRASAEKRENSKLSLSIEQRRSGTTPDKFTSKVDTGGISDEEIQALVDDAVSELSESEGTPAWTVTYGDLMSLLLVFFIMLFAISEVRVQKFKQVSKSLQFSFGVSDSAAFIDPYDDGTAGEEDEIMSEQVDNQLGHINEKLESFIAEHELANHLTVEQNRVGVTLKIQDMLLFDIGSALLKEETREITEKLSEIIIDIAVPVIISGHTDSSPISSEKYPSNWELSGARASALARLFISSGLPTQGIHIEGYAEFKPVDSNDSVSGRAKNRRVELLYTRQNVFEKIVSGKSVNDSTRFFSRQ
jgi:chemotaxis protein MotB